MKPAVNLFSAFVFSSFSLAVASDANAYYLENALPGTVTIAVTGACAIPSATANAYLADVSTDDRVLLGRGIVTASGKLLALEERHEDVRYHHVFATGEKSATDYVDFVGETLRAFLAANGANCQIETLEPDVGSKAVYQWSENGGKLNLKAGFAGHEKIRCFNGMEQERCLAQKIRGVIRFRGAWQNAG